MGVMKQPVDRRRGEGLGHELVKPRRVQVWRIVVNATGSPRQSHMVVATL